MSEKIRAKFPATTLGCSMVKIGRLEGAFLEDFNRKQAQQKVNHCSRKRRRGEKERGRSSKIEKHKDVGQNFDFYASPSKNVAKRDSSGKKGQLSCRKCIFDEIKANLAEIQLQNHQNVQKTRFWPKAPEVNGCRFEKLQNFFLSLKNFSKLPGFAYSFHF